MTQLIPLTIEVTSTKISNMSGVSKATGKNYSINKQEAWVFINNAPYPKSIELMLDDNQPPYNIGKYLVDLNACASVDRYGSLGVDMRNAVFHPKTDK